MEKASTGDGVISECLQTDVTRMRPGLSLGTHIEWTSLALSFEAGEAQPEAQPRSDPDQHYSNRASVHY